MKKLTNCISRTSWIIFSSIVLLPIIVILKPSFLEMIIFLFVDAFLAFIINSKYEGLLFKKVFPDTKDYFDIIDDDQYIKQNFSNFSTEQKKTILKSMMGFPLKRALWTSVGSYIKVIPAFLIVVFYWKHDRSDFEQFMIFLGLVTINFSYFYAVVFIESHMFLSNTLKKINNLCNWKDAFSTFNSFKLKNEFSVQEALVQSVIFVFTIGLQVFLLLFENESSQIQLVFKVVFVGIIGFILFSRIRFLNSQFFMGGLKDLFEAIDTLQISQFNQVLPMHTHEILARFEYSFNNLSGRLKKSEQEITTWVRKQMEQSRYQMLGQTTGLVVHDLRSPLHIIQYCLSKIKEGKNVDETYYERIDINMTRIIELVESIRDSLKNTETVLESTSFEDSHAAVMRVLETAFQVKKGYKNIKFEISPNFNSIFLKMSRVELIQVLDNIYRNSISHLLENNIENPELHLRAEIINGLSSEKLFKLSVHDNGKGMSLERFEQLTAIQDENESTQTYEGLGLKLTKRLVELKGGEIYLDKPYLEKGSNFIIVLPMADNNRGIYAEKNLDN